MGYILLGHGGLDVDRKRLDPEMEFVAIPAGTTLQFYTDAGQGLVYGARHLDLWEQMQAPWPALDSTRVTYNLTLYSARELWDEELKNNPSFGGHTLVRAGVDGVPDPIRMCTGTRKTCPTDPRQIAGGWKHGCDGILGTYAGDLYWLACSVFENADRQVTDTVMGGRSTDVLMGTDPEWVPGEADQEAIASVNGDNVKAVDDGDELPCQVGGFVLLIGDGHDTEHSAYARFQEDQVAGTVTVHKGGFTDPGSLEFKGIPPSKEGVVESAVSRFSKKEARFV
jgi:hypothetical protein